MNVRGRTGKFLQMNEYKGAVLNDETLQAIDE